MESTWWTKPEQLDDEQKKVVSLPPGGSHLVTGPPGCGKTNLLLLRATYLHKLKVQHLVVLTLGRVLREFLASGVANYPFAVDRLQTYVRWGATLLANNGIHFNETGSFPEVRERLLSELQRLARTSAETNQFDCILIDEAQDYSAEEIEVISKFAKRIFAVGDSKQHIMSEAGGALERLAELCDTSTELTAHYRSGRRICRVADGIRNQVDSEHGLEATSNYDEGEFPSSVKTFSGLDIREQVDTAIPEIETQLRAYPVGMIGVVCPRHEELSEVWSLLNRSALSDVLQLQQYSDGYSAFDGTKRVIVTTLHGAKGLEFRALHLLGMDQVKKFRLQTNMCFTAVTRAKTSLAIYHKENLPGYLERGIAALEHTTPLPPSLDELFL
jgi:superfamily I DNA/RNA helicase